MTYISITRPGRSDTIWQRLAARFQARAERRANRKTQKILAGLDNHLRRDIGLPHLGTPIRETDYRW